MPIFPLPQFEEDVKAHLDEEDRRRYEELKIPTSIVVRFGSMKLVGEFPYAGTVKPGCGSKVVIRSHRGTELGEMLTSTCPNSGCSKSVSRQEMLQYISNSGGRDYPFFTDGKVLRLATPEDVDAQAKLEQSKNEIKAAAREVAQRLRVTAKIVDVEPILGGEVLTIFYASEERIELRDLYRELSQRLGVRIDLKHVGARDEARLTADYEKCGQYCCCKSFLKVLKPISMKSAKTQKATLDPLKISGRCGRLMCCLRYEDQTYEDLRKRLPRKKSRVGTPEGDGLVLDSQILTQLVLVELDEIGSDGKIRQVAVAVEDLTPPKSTVAPVRPVFVPPPVRGPRLPQADRGAAKSTEAPRDGAPAEGGQRDAGTRNNTPREGGRPPQRDDRGQRPARPPRPPGPRPQAAPPAQRPPLGPPKPASRDEEVDDLMRSLEDDFGASPPPRGPGGTPPPRGGGGPGGPRRRRRGKPRGPGGGPGGPPPQANPPGPASGA
ncbi:MAG: regulatory iron-sulfur-containing complex subunit RicT [Phycisphaerales bacterium]|jgi:cell fate regulator YaaT (PSP1 superfamily)